METLPPGTPFGRYELIRRLAVGGMAELYLARATGIEGFEKLVALKRILPQHAAEDDFVKMFLDEARLTARIHHANVAAVYDIGRCDDGLFFTMEYVHGEDVRAIMHALVRKQRALPLEHALSIAIGAAAGLHAAHEQTIVHRDVSLSNLLVSYDGCLKVIDFGIAKAVSRQTQTRAGTLKGKIAYMSPEQCLGDPLDRRSDVFSLGVVLYELTTGQRLFPVDNEYTAMRQIVDTDAPLPSRRKPGYPPELEAIVMRALKRDRNERYGSAEELQLELEGFVRARGLAVSSAQLGSFMRRLFPDRVEIPQQHRVLTLPLRPLALDELPDRAPTLEPMVLGDSGPAANDEVPVSTGMFRPITIEEELEPSISISQDIPIEVAAAVTAMPTAIPRKRWHVPLALAITASISAVIAAVVVMQTQAAAPAAAAAVVEPRRPVPVPVPDPKPAAIVLRPAPAPDPAPPAVKPASKPAPKAKKPSKRSIKLTKKQPPQPASHGWNSDSALPPS